MKRKDTILIAAVVNAVLLIALFVTAIKRDEGSESSCIAETSPIALSDPPKEAEIKQAKGDEIDQVLKEFSEKKVVREEKPTSKIDFAKELEAITKAAAPKTQPAQVVKEGIEVVVKKGDVLAKIASAHGCSVDELIAFNHLSSTMLQIGQMLKIPAKGEKAARNPSDGDFYTVKQGDNPWTIAVKNHLKVEELLKLNNLNEEKARRLRPGDKLRIH